MIRGLGLLTMVAMTATAALAAFTMQPLQRADTPPGPGIPLPLAQERARRISDLRYDLHFSIAAEPGSPITGRVGDHVSRSEDARRSLALDFAPPKGVRRRPNAHRSRFATRFVPDHLVSSGGVTAGRPQRDPHRLCRRRRGAQSQPGVPLHAVRARARAPDVPGLRSAGPEGALDAGSLGAGRLAGDRQRRRDGATRGRRERST